MSSNKNELRGSEEHVTTDREKRLYQDNKSRSRQGVRELTQAETIEFLTYVIESRTGDMEFKLNLSRRDVEEVKARYGILVPEDARPIRDKLLHARDTAYEEEQVTRTDAKTEQQVRQRRQDAADAEARIGTVSKPSKPVDGKKEWQEREQRMNASKETVKVDENAWRLERADGDDPETWDHETVARFKNDILTRGFNFTLNKYGIEREDIVREAKRLNLKITDWNMVRR